MMGAQNVFPLQYSNPPPSTPVTIANLPADAAWRARQKLTVAALSFVCAVLDAASPGSVRKAEAEVIAANRTIADLPEELRANPELWDGALAQSYERVKTPTIKKLLVNEVRSRESLEWAQYLQTVAARYMGEIQNLAVKMIRDLYLETSSH